MQVRIISKTEIEVKLQGYGTSGYLWELLTATPAEHEPCVATQLPSDASKIPEGVIGAAAMEVWLVTGKPGTTHSLNFSLRRPWEDKEEKYESITITFGE